MDRFAPLLAFTAGLSAVISACIIAFTWTGRPVPGLLALLPVVVMQLAVGQLWAIGVLNRRVTGWRMTVGDMFAGLSGWQSLAAPAAFFAFWLVGMLTFPELPTDGVRSSTAERAAEQRFGVAVLGGFFSVHAAVAYGEYRLRAHRDVEPPDGPFVS